MRILAVMIALVGCKAFDDYANKAKGTEAKVMLDKLQKRAKQVVASTGKFPRGSVPLTPATPCCAGKDHQCVPTAADWANPVWRTLEFRIDDPHRFQYDYESDGKTATIRAIGDPECSGKLVTYEAHGNIVNGAPTFTLIDPP
jgi:hypothetical protein